MRLDARRGDRFWYVFDVKRCRHVHGCVWCDDQTAEWGGPTSPAVIINGELVLETHREDRITIYPDKRTVLFNEVDDHEQEPLQLQQDAPCQTT